MTETAALAPGTRAVVTTDIVGTWVGTVPAGTIVTIVDLGPEALAPGWDYVTDEPTPGYDYAAELADGRAVSFAAADLAPAPADPAPAPATLPVAALADIRNTPEGRLVVHRDGRALQLKSHAGGGKSYVYDFDACRDGYVESDDLFDLHAGQTIQLTEPQATVATYRFEDVRESDEDNHGAHLVGRTLVVDHVAEALATLDAALDICRDNVQSGYLVAKWSRELQVTQRLRAKILAAAWADRCNDIH